MDLYYVILISVVIPKGPSILNQEKLVLELAAAEITNWPRRANYPFVFHIREVWYHGQWCSSRGKSCWNTNLTEKKGCCIWYNEPAVSFSLFVLIKKSRERGGEGFKKPF